MALIDVLAAADPNNAGGWGTIDTPAPRLPQLIPVDHDPFASVGPFDAGMAIGDPETAGLAAASQAIMPAIKGLGRALVPDFPGAARAYLGAQADLAERDWSKEPLIGWDDQQGLTGRVPAFAEWFTGGLAGPVPGGGTVLGAGPRLGRGAIEATLQQRALADELRSGHLAHPDALPLLGLTTPVTPPPHIQTPADMDALVGRYADLAEKGAAYRDWYSSSGQGILGVAGDNPTIADKVAQGLASTSPATDVATNFTSAIIAHNQAMLGDPIRAGRFPQDMGRRIEAAYYGGEPLSGPKIEPFMGGVAETWNPDFAHTFVNDTHNMRAAEFPGRGGGLYNSGAPVAEQFGGGGGSSTSISLGQHNFTRILANRVGDELARRTGIDWDPKQAQAASWAAIKSINEGKPLSVTGADFADQLARNYAQLSYESAPGGSTNHLPEYYDASPDEQQAFHQAIRNVLTDDKGRDLIAQHLGLLTGPTLDAPGVYAGQVNPGSQAQVLTGRMPLKEGLGTDAASRELMMASEATRGALLRQDAAAGHRPTFIGMKPAQQNLVDVRLGRPATTEEMFRMVEEMKNAAGTDWFSPISTPNGFRLINNAIESKIDNPTFQKAVDTAFQNANFLKEANAHPGYADSFLLKNDWKEQPNGEAYLASASRSGRPDVQRRVAELLATLGPRVSQVEEDFAHRLGWTPNRDTRVWETSPIIQQHAGAVIPSPPQPWQQRPAPPGGPSLFGGGPSGSAYVGPGVEAYHGSPHEFPRFSSAAIGTGEGAQAYGRGLYFAEAEPVAQSYRLTKGAPAGQNPVTAQLARQAMSQATAAGLAGDEAKAAALQWLDAKARTPGRPGARDYYDAINNFDALMGGPGASGHMYQTRLNVDPESLLDWDKPIREQPQAVRDLTNEVYQAKGVALRPIGSGLTDVMIGKGSVGAYPDAQAPAVAQNLADHLPGKGSDLHRELTNALGDQASAADEMRRRGIPGVRYLDQGSRGGEGQGTHNYVVFDDKLIDILKKYGLGALIAGGAAAIGGNAQVATHAIPVDHDPFAVAGAP